MLQSRLYHVMLMSINKDRLDHLDLNVIGDDFVRGSLACFGSLVISSDIVLHNTQTNKQTFLSIQLSISYFIT